MNSKERAAARRNDKVARTVFQDIHPDREPSLSGSGYRNSTALTVTSPSTASTRPHSTSSPHPLQPADDPINLTRLGLSLEARGQMDGARAAYLRAIAADPRFIPARLGLGNLLHRQHHDREAEMAFREAITQDHGNKDSWTGLGLSLQHQGQLDAALAAFRQAAQVGPANAAAHCNLGTLLFALDHNDEALAELNHALQLDSHYASAHGNLGALLARAGRPIAAEVASRAAIGFAPNEHRWLTNLGVALLSQGRYAEAEASYRKALAMQPGYASGHGNLLFALNYRPDVTADAVFAEYREWDRRHAKPLAPSTQGQAMAPGSVSRLRIGYVSADFRQHAVAMFAEPLLRAHDRANVELYLYADVASEDSTTHRFRSLCDHWHSTIGLSDAQLDQLIRGDKIDVLIDLAGHSAANRLLTFARRPAPVQVAYLLGHGYTTGLSAMDVFLADEHLAPPGSEALFSERLIRLDRIPIVYAPPDDMPPVAPLPVSLSGSITFGHFGRTERLNEYVVAAWARILHAVPGSRLVLNNRPFQEPAFRDMFLKRFNNHGIESSRLELICTAPQSETWMAYARIDIALDPFPHNAGTTTIEALWQGVPVVSLAGRASVGRFGTSILHAAGLDDWVTTNVDDYVARAAAAASDLPALALLRQTLRQRINASPLCDATGLASTLEAVYRRLYEEKYGGNRQALHQLYASGDSAAASDLAEEILGKDSGDATAHHVLGLLAYQAGHFHTADVHLSKALVRSHGLAELHANHAAILRKLGRLTDAETAARTALTLEPERVGAHNNLGNILRDAGRYEESGDCYRTAVRLEPGFTEAWINLSWVLTLGGRTQQGEAAARRAIACDPNNADGHNNLGLALTRQGRLAEAEAALRRALALRPDFALPHSNILFCLNYHPTMPASEIFAEYQRWDRQHAIALRPADPRFENDRLPHRRLRVGYVSPDFRQHAAALFAEPLLSAHDRSVIELYCYAEVAAPDAVTERFRVLADHWHNSVGLSDSDLAEQIRKDRIDILVDIAGHTAGNRLLAFARKPAPVQVTWLLGHGYTSGLSVMDAFLADDELAPPGAEALFSESLVRLSRIPLAYAPPTNMPDTAPLPARIKGYITFGYFGRTVRLNDLVLSAWARILAALPSARLMLNSAPFSEPAGRDQMAARFATLGIDRERLDLTCTTPQPRTWAAYGEVDIALDPFPHNAGTTTFEALWQGVPVVTLAGRPSVGRFGASILHAAGLDSWIAQDVDDYVACAVEGAGDLEALSLLRAELRARVAASPLCDAAGLALEMEQAYRTLWQRWCVSHAPDVRQLYSAGRVDEAIRLAEARLRDDPYDDAALHVCALARFALADIPAAVALLRRASQCKPSAAILSDLGVMLRAMGQPGEAEAAYRHALHLEPTLAQALGNLGNLLLDQHRHEEAESCLNDALGQTPNGPWLLRSLALCQMARGAAAEAESALRRAIEVDPSDPDAHDTLGALLGQSGRPIEAEFASQGCVAEICAAASSALQSCNYVADTGQAR
ncbi:MAG: tetratricopeptide repeat protein [Acetobacteraceae bacterium]